MMRLPVQAVVHTQEHVGRFGSFDHRLTLLGARCHRLLAHDMLARFGCRDAVLRVQRVRRDDMHDGDVFRLGQPRHVGIREDVFLREAVLRCPLAPFGDITGDGSGEIHVLRQRQFRRDGLLREAAEPAQGDTELAFIRGLRTDNGVEAHDGRCGEGGGFEEGTTGGGGWIHGVMDSEGDGLLKFGDVAGILHGHGEAAFGAEGDACGLAGGFQEAERFAI